MPVAPTFPGVYIEEITSGVRTVNLQREDLVRGFSKAALAGTSSKEAVLLTRSKTVYRLGTRLRKTIPYASSTHVSGRLH
jgi:hypothetical protein